MKQKTDAWNSMSFFATQNKNVWKASEHKSEALHWQIQLGLTSIFLRVSCDSAKHENCKSINLISGFSPTLTYTTPHQNWPTFVVAVFYCSLTKKYDAGCVSSRLKQTPRVVDTENLPPPLQWVDSPAPSRRPGLGAGRKLREKFNQKRTKKQQRRRCFCWRLVGHIPVRDGTESGPRK